MPSHKDGTGNPTGKTVSNYSKHPAVNMAYNSIMPDGTLAKERRAHRVEALMANGMSEQEIRHSMKYHLGC